jgi:hypothetical protein
MKRKYKDIVVEKLATHLRRFHPELTNHFICPICLEKIPAWNRPEISEAHIIPRAADGRLVTLACTKCNKESGTAFDKWFGEYVRLRQGNKELLETKFQAKGFKIDGVQFSGKHGVDQEGGIVFYIHENLTSPNSLTELNRRLHAEGFGGAKLSVKIPIVAKESEIKVGFLTAAYLLWFYSFGYSWALQEHLEIVRKQIRNPAEQVIRERYDVCFDGPFFNPPWVGVARYQSEIVLIAAIADRFVSLPAVDRPNWPFADQSDPHITIEYRILDLYKDHSFNNPLAIIFDNRLLVAPDVILRRQVEPCALVFPTWDGDRIVKRFEPSSFLT